MTETSSRVRVWARSRPLASVRLGVWVPDGCK